MSGKQSGENIKSGFACPGSISVKQPFPEIFFCPNCGTDIEIWTNERMRKCDSCGNAVVRDMGGASCVQWCERAKDCVGEERYGELLRTGVISKDGEVEARIPEKLKEFMRECGIPVPGEDT